MDNQELINNFKGLCKEIYKIPEPDYKTIFFLIDNLDKISNLASTEAIIKEHCKAIFNILIDHDLWPIFKRILKNAHKYGDYKLIVTDGRLFL